MTKKLLGVVAVVLAVSFVCSAYAEKKFAAKCPISGGAAKEGCSVDYKGGKVYFCCDGCPDGFKKNTAKYAAKANQQLVITGQAKQEKCPLSGGKCNPASCVEVGGVKVCFCCDNCKTKVEKAAADEQLTMIFGDKAFDKSFKVGK